MEDLNGSTQTKKKGMHGCLKAFLIVFAIGVIIAIISSILIYKGAKIGFDKIKEISGQEYVEKGYSKTTGQNIIVDEAQDGDVVYFCQDLKINAENNGNVALILQNATINSIVDGNVDFFGQVFNLTADGQIKGDLTATGQSITINGDVDGAIEITAQVVNIRADLKEKENLLLNAGEINTIPYTATKELTDSLSTSNEEIEEAIKEEAVTESE